MFINKHTLSHTFTVSPSERLRFIQIHISLNLRVSIWHPLSWALLSISPSIPLSLCQSSAVGTEISLTRLEGSNALFLNPSLHCKSTHVKIIHIPVSVILAWLHWVPKQPQHHSTVINNYNKCDLWNPPLQTGLHSEKNFEERQRCAQLVGVMKLAVYLMPKDFEILPCSTEIYWHEVAMEIKWFHILTW